MRGIFIMMNMNIRDMDLNLLVAFDALIKEGNVARAAFRIGPPQSSDLLAARRGYRAGGLAGGQNGARSVFLSILRVLARRGISSRKRTYLGFL